MIERLESLRDALSEAVDNGNEGVKSFSAKWQSWSDAERKQFLCDVREVIEPYRELKLADIHVAAELDDAPKRKPQGA